MITDITAVAIIVDALSNLGVGAMEIIAQVLFLGVSYLIVSTMWHVVMTKTVEGDSIRNSRNKRK